MSKKGIGSKIGFVIFAILISIIFVVTGCKQWNDNPAESGKITIDISSIQRQLGYGTGDSSAAMAVDSTGDQTGPFHVASEATTQVKTLLVGAVVVRSRDTPFNSGIAITDTVADELADDIINSINYFTLVPLPASVADSKISFAAPPEEAGKWQVTVIGADAELKNLADIAKDENKNTTIYYGFHEQFVNTSDDLNNLQILLKRACLKEGPPKGCAYYHERRNNDPVVTAAVEITKVEIDGNSLLDPGPNAESFPLIVRETPNTTIGEIDVQTAVNALQRIKDSVSNAKVTKISVTHAKNTLETAGCKDLVGPTSTSKPSIADLESNCEIQQNVLTIESLSI